MCNSDGLNIIAHPQHRDNHGICSGNTGVVKIDKFLKGVYPMSNYFGVDHNGGNHDHGRIFIITLKTDEPKCDYHQFVLP